VEVADRTVPDYPDATARLPRAIARVAACAAAAVVLAACSSSPSATEQAQKERAAVLPAAKQLHSQVVSAGVGWTALLLGDYQACGANDPLATSKGSSMLQYTAQQLMTPFSHAVSFETFARQVVETVNAAGWHLRPVAGPSGQGRYYAGQRGGFDLRVVEFNDEQGVGPGGSYHPTATLYVSGPCFDAGSSAHDLVQQGAVDNVHSPVPTTTPVPKYS
jgi:hypothetical protein